MVFFIKHCSMNQPCLVYKIPITREASVRVPYIKSLYVWYLPECKNPKCKKKVRAIYYALDGWNNWHQQADVPRNKIDEVIKSGKKVTKIGFKRFCRKLSKQTTKDTRFFLYAAVYGQKVKCYGSKLGRLPALDENLPIVNLNKDNNLGVNYGSKPTKFLQSKENII